MILNIKNKFLINIQNDQILKNVEVRKNFTTFFKEEKYYVFIWSMYR